MRGHRLCSCTSSRDELPVTLVLPKAILAATSHQELASLALLGQDFWTATLSPKRPSTLPSEPVIPYHTTGNSPDAVTMETAVNNTHQHSGTARLSTTVSRTTTTSREVTSSSSCRKSAVIQQTITTTSNEESAANGGRSMKQSFRSEKQTFRNGGGAHSPPAGGVHSRSLPTASRNGVCVGEEQHPVGFGGKLAEPPDGATIAATANGLLRPVVTNLSAGSSTSAVRKQRRGGCYNGGSLEDRLSDYEDVWTATFRPIQTARSVQELVAKSNNLDSERELVGSRFSAVNPGYVTDSCSERDFHLTADAVSHARTVTATATPTVNRHYPPGGKEQVSGRVKPEVHRNEVLIGLGERAPDPVVFTFELGDSPGGLPVLRAGSEPREPPSRQPPTPPVRRHRLERSRHYSRQHQQHPHPHCQPGFAGSFDVSSSHTVGGSGPVHCRQQEALGDCETHSVILEPIASPRLLERLPHQRPTQANIYENAQQMLGPLSRSDELLNTASSGDALCTAGQGEAGQGGAGQGGAGSGPGYTRSLSLPRHLQHLSLGEQDQVAPQGGSTGGYNSQQQQQMHQQLLQQQQLQQHQQGFEIIQNSNNVDCVQQQQQQLHQQQQQQQLSQALSARLAPGDGARTAGNGVRTTPSPPVGRFPVYDNHHFAPAGVGGGGADSVSDEESTVEDLIADVSPDLTVQPLEPLTVSNVSRMSEYDNVNGVLGAGPASSRRTGPASSVATYYCQPWDSSLWDDLLNLGSTSHRPRGPSSWMGSAYTGSYSVANGLRGRLPLDRASSVGGCSSSAFLGSLPDSVPLHVDVDGGDTCGGSEYDGQSEPLTSCRSVAATSFEWLSEQDSTAETTPRRPLSVTPPGRGGGGSTGEEEEDLSAVEVRNYASLAPGQLDRFQDISDDEGIQDVDTGSFRERLMPFLGSKRFSNLQRRGKRNAGVMMRDYIANLAENKGTTFGITIENFIKCTKEGSETNPHIVTRNVRQFMNGMKNYLIHHGEENLNKVIEEERSKLESDEFLNIDAIIEGALHKAVIKPLKHHVYQLFVDEYRRVGALRTLSDNIRYAQTKTAQELGIREGIVPPEGAALEEIKVFLEKMQKSYSPLRKLENLLGATSAIYNSVQSHDQTGSKETIVSLAADDFLPLFIWVLVQCGMVSAEVEAEYMWGLLHPCLLAGEGGYYLTTLSSAVTALKNFKHSQMTVDLTQEQPQLPNIADLQGFMKILIPDELRESIITKTLPVRPNMTSRDVCSMIAHKFRITNPQDYGLYVLVDGEESRHGENLAPQATKAELTCEGKKCVFAYKRNNAKFVWPVTLSR